MTLYGFRDKSTAENLKQFGETMRFSRTPKITRATGSETITVKITEEIAAVGLSGNRSSGLAIVVQFDGDGSKSDINTEIIVFNSTSEVLAVNDQVQVVKEGSKWTTVIGSGGGGGGTDTAKTYQFKTTTAIPAGSPLDGSVGTGSANLWNFNGSTFSIDSSTLYDIVNPWELTVSSNILITAYQSHTHPDKYILLQAECEESSGDNGGDNGGGDTDPEGYCIDDTTGAVTSNVLQSACTGTWSASEPTTGCCNISGTEHADVAESWCTTQSGSFTAGACPPAFDACAENARFKVTALTYGDSRGTNCATTPWSVSGLSGNPLGNLSSTCTKVAYNGVTIVSSENPPSNTGVIDCSVVYNSTTGDWDLSGEIRYFDTSINAGMGGNTSLTFVGTLPNTLTACATTISGALTGTNNGFYLQTCDFSNGSAMSGSITLELECF